MTTLGRSGTAALPSAWKCLQSEMKRTGRKQKNLTIMTRMLITAYRSPLSILSAFQARLALVISLIRMIRLWGKYY